MLVEEIQTALLNEHSEAIYRMIREHHPADIALALEELEDEEVFKFVSFISDKALALILETQISEELQVKIVEAVPFARMLNVFTYMSQDDIVDILGNLSIWQRKQFLNMMKNRDSDDLEKLLAYDPDTAGGLMTTEFIALKPSRPFVRLRRRRKLSRPSSWSMPKPYSKGQSISAIFSPNPINKNSVKFLTLTSFR